MSFRDFKPRDSRGGAEFDRPTANNGRKYNTATAPQKQQQQQQLKKNSLRRVTSGSNVNTKTRSALMGGAQGFNPIEFCRSKSESDYGASAVHQSLMVQQREEEYSMRVMQQREEELRDIHRKMHVVNEIYKELGEIVGQQQEQIDEIENKFGGASESTRRGLEQIEQANSKKRERRKKDGGGIEGEDGDRGPDNATRFFLFRYLSKTASEISKALSVCGSGSIDLVDDRCCKP
jgi:hypothetical protein